MSPWPRSPGGRIACALWSLPYGIVGLAAAVLFAALGWGHPRASEGALDVAASGPIAQRLRSRGYAAFTLGWTIFYFGPGGADDERARRHERVHVRQALWFGPLMPVLYLAFLAATGYRRNPFERAARAGAEGADHRSGRAPVAEDRRPG